MEARPNLTKMRWLFLLSILLMLAHKIESYRTKEWNFAPAYQGILGLQFDEGKMVFLVFVITMFAGLLWLFILISVRYGTWIFLTFWGLTFILECHHIFRTLWAGTYYSGLYTAIIYAMLGFIYWKELARQLYLIVINKRK